MTQGRNYSGKYHLGMYQDQMVVLSVLRSSLMNETQSQPTATQVLKEKASMILTVLAKMKNLGKNVMFYRSRCEYFGQRSSAASEEIHACWW